MKVASAGTLSAWVGFSVIATTLSAFAAPGTVEQTIIYTTQSAAASSQGMASAQPTMPLIDPETVPPSALLRQNTLPTGVRALTPGLSQGSADGVHRIAPPAQSESFGDFAPQAIAPYTTARASASIEGPTPTASSVAVTSYPWRATGKLISTLPGGTMTEECTASLIGPGLLLTAAHCVYKFGSNSASAYNTNVAWTPAQYDPNAAPPYGVWTAVALRIPSVYFDGTDTCVTGNVMCNNDIATVTLSAQNGTLPGTILGWYAYSWDGYSYTTSFGGASLALVTQLGYPHAFDNGLMMERTDGIASFWANGSLWNTVLGTAQTAGASGGPWLVNFGTVPTLSAGASAGSQSTQAIIGVTSWGYTTIGQNTMGSSWFGQNTQYPLASYADGNGINRGAGNIGKLVADSCLANFDHC